MLQAVISRYGGPDVFELRERADPKPGPDEVRIRVRAAGVNFADVLARLGVYPDAPGLPLVVGYEVAGTIDATGAGVTRLAAGDRVVALTRFGGYADTVTVPADLAFHAPAALADTELAALPVNYLTALVALHRMANVQAGETVLLHGAGGGVGTAAVQLARLRRAIVIGVASAGKHEALRAMGVTHLVAPGDDVRSAVLGITGGRGVDVALDPNGGRSFRDSYRLLAPLGRLVMFGASSVAPGETRRWLAVLHTLWTMPRFAPMSLINRNRGVFGLNLAHLWSERREIASAMESLLEDASSGRLAPVVARTFPLAAVAEAHRFLQQRQNIGKVVLTI
ncbi:MAG: zinc-binding dehydrogenase [Vicinamibacterales bacterium]|nr:zinc-binding dehydrogenase [Vicinamibacterales bacterium]